MNIYRPVIKDRCREGKAMVEMKKEKSSEWWITKPPDPRMKS